MFFMVCTGMFDSRIEKLAPKIASFQFSTFFLKQKINTEQLTCKLHVINVLLQPRKSKVS